MVTQVFSSGRDTIRVRKTADETVNNSATLQDDDDLKFPVGLNETWYFMATMRTDSGATPDIKVAVTVPTAADIIATFMGTHTDGTYKVTTMNVSGTAISAYGAGAGTTWSLTIIGTVRTGANTGNVQFQWAQNTANASDTKVLADSVLVAWRIAG